LVEGRKLPAAAQVSALKTLFALGGPKDREEVDRMEAEELAKLAQSDQSLDASPYVPAADRIGGSQTLAELRRLHSEATARQAAATKQEPQNFSVIGALDKTRDRLQRQVAMLTRKTEIQAKSEPART